MTTPEEREEARGIYVECERLRAEKGLFEHLRRCLRLDESRLSFIRTQGDEVERRIEQTRAALACFDAEATGGEQ